MFGENINTICSASFQDLRNKVAQEIRRGRGSKDVVKTAYRQSLSPQTNLFLTLSDKINELGRKPNVDNDHLFPQDVSDRKIKGRIQDFTFNEMRLYDLEPEVKKATGAIIATGSVQGISLLSMAPSTTELHIVDWNSKPLFLVQSFLEVGLRLRKLLGRDPSREEYISFFAIPNRELLTDLLSLPIGNHYRESKEIVQENVSKMISYNEFYADYLQFFSSLYPSFWLNQLSRILDMYDQGNIHIHKANLFGGHTMRSIKRSLRKRGESLGILYVSNAPGSVRALKGITRLLYHSMTPETSCILTTGGIDQLEQISEPKFPHYQHEWTYCIYDRDSFPLGWVNEKNNKIRAERIRQGVYRVIKNAKNSQR